MNSMFIGADSALGVSDNEAPPQTEVPDTGLTLIIYVVAREAIQYSLIANIGDNFNQSFLIAIMFSYILTGDAL